MTHPINWEVIGESLSFYKKIGYQYIEVPWTVGEEALKTTLPPGRKGIHCDDGALVGSAEQSFIQLMLDEKLQPGRYVAATPCFRDEQSDTLHQRSFFKVELINFSREPMSLTKELVWEMATNARTFFHQTQSKSLIFETEVGLDIELNGIEIGSYGYRNYKNNHWIYGTGMAEPRFSQAVAEGKINE